MNTPQVVGDQVETITIPADQVRQDQESQESDSTFSEQLDKELGQDGEQAEAPKAPVPAPAPAPKPGKAEQKIPDEIPDVETDDADGAEKPDQEKPKAEIIKPHSEFTDARSLRPAYEALRVRCETAEKAIGERDSKISDLTRQIEEAKHVKEEAEQLRARVDNVNFRETEPYKQAIEPLKAEANSILTLAGELPLNTGKVDAERVERIMLQMANLPDRGQRRRMAMEVFDDADVGTAVDLAGRLADVDRRYRAKDGEFAKNSGEFLKTYRVKQVGKLREDVVTVQREMDHELGAIAKSPALKDARDQGERMAETLLKMDDLPPRQRAVFMQDVYWRLARFDATLALAMNVTRKLEIANAALKKRGIRPVTDADPGGSTNAVEVPTGKNGGKDMTIGDELDVFIANPPNP